MSKKDKITTLLACQPTEGEYNHFYWLIRSEFYDASECILKGLNALPNIDYYNGVFYSFFNDLSFGIERVLKLILLLDPLYIEIIPNKHNLTYLIGEARIIENPKKRTCFVTDILLFLDDFVNATGRYNRLTTLTNIIKNSNQQPSPLPEEKWSKMVYRLASFIVEEHPNCFDNRSLENFKNGYKNTKLQQCLTQYLRMGIGQIIRPIYQKFDGFISTYKIPCEESPHANFAGDEYKKLMKKEGVPTVLSYLREASHVFLLMRDDEYYFKTTEWGLINE